MRRARRDTELVAVSNSQAAVVRAITWQESGQVRVHCHVYLNSKPATMYIIVFLRIALFVAAECANVQYGCNLVVCCRIGNLVKHLHSNRGDEAARNVASPGIVVRTRHADDRS